MKEITVLVTGARGKTGLHTVSLLRKSGHRVRALVHQEDHRSAELRRLGAETVVGDLLNLHSVDEALEGTDTAYFCYPIAPGLVEASAYFAQAAKERGLAGVVNMSQISARPEAVSNAARQHWISERIFDWSGVPVTHLRPTFFAEWLLILAKPMAKQGELALPFGDGRHAPIAAEDQAQVIASILGDPNPHAGKTYPLFGPVEMSHYDIASAVGRVLGRDVRSRPIEVSQFVEWLKSRSMSPHLIQHLSNVAVDYRNGIFAGTNDAIESIAGVVPMTVAEFVERNRSAFQTQPADNK